MRFTPTGVQPHVNMMMTLKAEESFSIENLISENVFFKYIYIHIYLKNEHNN